MVLKFLTILLIASVAKADVLFEGYYKITVQNQHVGYSVSRYEFNPKTKQFTYTNLTYANNAAESVKSVSNENLQPISYQYNFLVDKTMKLVDASFKNNKMIAKVTEGKNTKTLVKDMPKGTFLSYFLAYVMLKSPTGIKVDTKYDYNGVAEEDAEISKGIAIVKNTEDFSGVKAYKILNNFKNSEFITYASLKGDLLYVYDPKNEIKSELVKKPEEAIAQFNFNKTAIKLLFLNIPEGKLNDLVRSVPEKTSITTPATLSTPDAPAKEIKK